VTSAAAISGASGRTLLACNDQDVETANGRARRLLLDKRPEKILDTPRTDVSAWTEM